MWQGPQEGLWPVAHEQMRPLGQLPTENRNPANNYCSELGSKSIP